MHTHIPIHACTYRQKSKQVITRIIKAKISSKIRVTYLPFKMQFNITFTHKSSIRDIIV